MKSDPSKLPKGVEKLTPQQLALLVARLAKKAPQAPAATQIVRRGDGAPPPLSLAQHRFWLLDQIEPGNTAYNMPLAIRLRGALDRAVLDRVLSEIVRRHEALRTTFELAGEEPVQRIAPAGAPAIPLLDLSAVPAGPAQSESERLTAEEARRPFDLARGPLLRAFLVRLGASEHVLSLDVHHIVSDGWSLGLLTHEISVLYAAFSAGSPSPLPELPIQYADFAAWQRRWLSGPVLEEHLAFWRERLAGAPRSLELPTDRLRPAAQTHRGAVAWHRLPAALLDALRELARRLEASLFMVLLAVWKLQLSRWSGQDDVVVGAPSAGRQSVETEGLIGLFLNNLVLRTDLSGDPTFTQLVARVKEVVLGAYRFQGVPFEKLLDELKVERDLSRPPLFQVLFNMVTLPPAELTLAGLTLERVETGDPGAKLDFTLYLTEDEDGLAIQTVYNADLFDRARIEEMLRQYEHLLAQAVARPESPVGSWSLVTREAAALLPDPSAPLPDAWRGAVHEAMARHAAEAPNRLAVVAGRAGAAETYGELAARAAQLAAFLADNGIVRGDAVALWAHRDPSLVWGALGVLEAGAAMMVLDPAYPAARLLDYLEIGRPKAWIAVHGAPEPPPEVLAALPPLRVAEPPAGPAAGGRRIAVGPDDPACITFTSGSTGKPKGVVGRHGPLTHFYPFMAERFGLGAADRFGMLSALSHDPLQRDLFTPLWLGAALCVPEPQQIGDPGYLAQWVEEHGVTVLHLTPAMLDLLVAAAETAGPLPSLRRAFVVGDLLKQGDVERLYRVAPNATCYNLYGSTETQRSVAYFEVPRGVRLGREVLPLGRGMEGTQLLVLSRSRQLAGVSELGEIHMRGPHLAAGYLGDLALTAERFLANPFGPGDRVYKTGDLGRYLPDGNAEIVGRVDFQVKIRGFRIELGEVEAALARLEGVEDCVAVVREDRPGDPGSRRLVAYLVGRGIAAPRALRSALLAALPDYMVPAAFVVLPALPLTHTGKVDRLALPAPVADQGAVERERGPIEELIADVWCELLAVPSVGSADGFFDLGGHSLLATRMVSKLRDLLRVEVPLRTLFEDSTLEGFARRVEELRGGVASPPLVPQPRAEGVPLSLAQQRLWLLHLLEPGSSVYNMPAVLHLHGALDTAALGRACRELARRHESLRTVIAVEGETPRQRILAALPAPPAVVELSGLGSGRAAVADRLARLEMARPFDLLTGPLVRWTLLRLGPDEHRLVVNVHHIVSDGWSVGILLHELAALTKAFSSGSASPLPALPVQYADFAIWQRNWLDDGRLLDQLAYWRGQLAGLAPLELPADRPRPRVQSFRGAVERGEIGADLAAALQRLARTHQATLFMTLLAAFEALLGRLSGQQGFAVGTPIAGRNRSEVEGLIGFFVNTLVLRADLSGEPSFAALAARVRETALAAYAHQDVTFERVVEELAPERDLSRTPLFQVAFALQSFDWQEVDFGPGVTGWLEGRNDPSAKFDLSLFAARGASGALGYAVEYSTDLFNAATVRRFMSHFETLLAGIAAAPEASLAELPLLSAAERHQLLVGWNQTAAGFPRELPVHRLFERQARATPEAPALRWQGGSLSYAELDRRATRLARRLCGMGVAPGSLVAILLERSQLQVTASLAVLKAGAAYVPLDPKDPAERLRFVLADTAAQAVIVGESLPAELGEVAARLLPLAADAPAPEAPLPAEIPAESPAYVIYTSGSTGRPKGVVVPHRAINRLVLGTDYVRLGPGDRVAHLSNPAFDAVVFEIWGALLNGAAVEIIARDVALEPETLARAFRERGITSTFVTTALFNLLQREAPGAFGGVRDVLFGGEAVDPSAVAACLAQGPPQRLLHVYGPTESTTFATWLRVTRVEAGRTVPIGLPIANTVVHVLDRWQSLAPVGVPGELVIGGDGLAHGYLLRPDVTAERFVPDPFGPPGARVYRTGDLVRRNERGDVEFLGRLDGQVKLRGFRIELGEIEAALLAQPDVAAAVAVVREDDPGDRRLVAYLVARTGGEIDPRALRGALRERLPGYMVPAAFEVLERLPLNPNGKVDRRALPAPGAARGAAQLEPPQTAVEELVAQVWCDLLKRERVGRDDSFWDLGGHSLLATRVISRVRDLTAADLALRDVFEEPTLAGFARLVERAQGRGGAAAPPLVAGQRPARPPLSFAQQRLWFIDQLEPLSSTYNLSAALLLAGALDRGALARSLTEIARRHETLRTVFDALLGEPFAVIAEPAELALPLIDLSGLAAPLRDAEAVRLAQAAGGRPFDLARGPLLRALLLYLEPRRHALLLATHHIISDGWSLGILGRELGALYAAFVEARPSPLPELPLQYADFAAWQRRWLHGEALAVQLAYWREQLAGAPPALELPTDRPRAARTGHRGARHGLALGPEVTAAVEAAARRSRATPFMVLLAAWAAVLARHSRQDDVVVGTPIANRTRSEVEDLIGFFANTLALRTVLAGAPGLAEVVARVRETALGAYAHQDLPFEKLVEELHPQRDLQRSPVFQVTFALENLPDSSLELPGLTLSWLAAAEAQAHFDLSLAVAATADGYAAHFNFSTELFDQATVERLARSFATLLGAGLASPEEAVFALPMLSPDEEQQLRAAWLATPRPAAVAPPGGGSRLPQTVLERQVGAVWAEVLKVDRVAADETFWDLGGHSLLATKVLARIRQALGVELPIRALFEHPTVAAFAAEVARARGDEASAVIARRPRTGGEPLSFAQERLWLLDRLEPGNTAYNMPFWLRWSGALERTALARALGEIVRRHEVLRTRFVDQGGAPLQIVEPPCAVALPRIDLRRLPDAAAEAECPRVRAAISDLPFDLARAPQLRAVLVETAEEEHQLFLGLHHIVADGWSIDLLYGELSALYGAFVAGRPSPLPELPIQFADFALWQREHLSGAVLERQLGYWRSKLAGAPPVLELPTDRLRPPVPSHRGGTAVRWLELDLTLGLRELSRRLGASLFMTLLAGCKLLLSRLAGQDDVVVGSPSAGRERVETEGLIGLFLNTLVLRTDLSGDPSFTELVGRVKDVVLEGYRYQEIPFERLLAELQPDRQLSRAPVFQVLFNMITLDLGLPELAGAAVEPVRSANLGAKFDLTLYVRETGDRIAVQAVYDADLFDPARIEELLRQLEHLSAQAVGRPEAPIGSFSLVTPAALLPDPRAPLPDDWRGAVHQGFGRQAARAPEQLALVGEGESWTYGELAARTDEIAQALLASGVGPGDVVAIWAHRCPALAWAVMGTLAAGATTMILDPAYPAARLREYLEIGKPKAWLPVPGAPEPPEQVRAALPPALLPGRGARGEDRAGAVPVGPDDAACLTFTSGSTGKPKAVVGLHGSLAHFLPFVAERFSLSSADRFGMLSALAHDPFQRDLFTPLWLGATLCVPDPERIASPGYLARWVRSEGVSVLNLTPAMLEVLIMAAEEAGEPLPSLRRAFVVGDALKRSDVDRLRRRAPNVTVTNLYGATETQRALAFFDVPPSGSGREVIPLGRGMEGAQLLVLTPAGGLAGVGELGELCLRSPHLARGYLDDPALTAERFQPDLHGGRLYRTGDLGRYLADGNAEIVGRADFQVKIRGFRIELGEVEAAVAAHPRVEECVVVVREDRPGDRRLAAYVVGQGAPEVRELREFLARRLPDFMLPGAVVHLAALPVTPAGKVDRLALPAPALEEARGERELSPTEELLAGLWSELLDRPRVAAGASFFELGGHSLSAMRMISRVRDLLGVEVPLRTVFEDSTLAGFARRVEALSGSGQAPPLEPQERPERPPLSLAQQRLWVLHLLEPESPVYNMPAAVRLSGPLDAAALSRALGAVVGRHEALRTAIAVSGDEPWQQVLPAESAVLRRVDLSALGDAAAGEALRLVREETARPFDLSAGPLLRAALITLAADEHLLLVNVHHIVSDGWSVGVLLGELGALTRAFAQGLPSPLAPLPVQYADFALWQRQWLLGGVLDAQLAYWRGRLAGLAPLDLPTDRARPRVQTFRGAVVRGVLPAAVVEPLERLSRERQATLFMTLLAAFQTLLGRLSGQEDFAVGSPIAGRNRSEVEGLIGFFANTLVLRADLAGDPGLGDLLGRVRETALGAYAHQDVTFERIVEELAPERDLSRTPLFQVAFALQGFDPAAADFGPGVTAAPLERQGVTAKFDLSLFAARTPGGLVYAVEHSTDLFDDATVQRWLGQLETLLAAIVATPDARLGLLPLLTAPERQALLFDCNRTAADYPRERSIPAGFARQAAATPAAPALVWGEESLSYGDLAARATRLARRLRARGVGLGTPVALVFERSAEQVVASLAVLAAGGTYVPLDPKDPAERLSFVLADTGAPVVLVPAELPAGLDVSAAVFSLDQLDREGGEAELPADIPAESPAYVIYTSGSTGRPKGVVVPHRAVGRLVKGTDYVRLAPGDRVAHLSNPAFDAVVFEIWGALLNGAAAVVVPREVALEPARLAAEIRRRGITTMFMTTALFNLLQREAPGALAEAREVLFGGEQVDPDAVRSCLADGPPRRLLHVYGPTESTTFSTWHEVTAVAPGRTVPIGRPLANTTAYVLDRWGQPAATGVPGELLIGGDGLALGYFGRPELTAERFVPDPFGPAGARLYRTGDLVRRNERGDVEFLGRIDHQVKLRGFRIEPGEIESVLLSRPEVAAAAVVLREDEPGDRRLVGYLVPSDGEIDLSALRAFLRSRLPEQMVPSALVVLSALPLNPNGKVDRRALPAPERTAADRAVTAPRTPLEQRLVEVWAEVLKVGGVGVDDSFWDLGGHSLLATKVLGRVRRALGVELPLRALFEHPTLGGFAAEVERLRTAGEQSSIPRRGASGPAPLTFAQERLWLLDRIEPGNVAYNMSFPARWSGPFDEPAFARAVGEIVRRHGALRTAFVAADGSPVQRVAEDLAVALPRIDLRGLELSAARAEGERLVDLLAYLPFDLARAPLLRTVLVAVRPAEHLVLLGLHHIVADGWSVDLFFQELAALYQAFASGLASQLPELAVQYADFAAWQRERLAGPVLDEQLGYWRRQLAGAPPALELPTDRIRPAVPTHRGGVAVHVLPGELSAGLRALSRESGTSLFMTLLAGFNVVLGRLAGQDDVVVGAPSAGRERVETERLIGLFLNTLVLRTDLSGAPTFGELVARVKDMVLDAYRYQEIPFERLLAELQPERQLSRAPIFQVLFNMVTLELERPVPSGLAIEPVGKGDPGAKYDWTLYLRDQGDRILVQSVYDADLFDRPRVDEMLRQFETVLTQAVARPQAPIASFSLVTREAAALLPDPQAPLPGDWLGAVHQGFSRQAQAAPEKLALRGENESWTYGELEARANQLAWSLIASGVEPGDVVALWAHRSPALAWAVMGTQKAGATMMIVDPAYPAARLLDYLDIGRPKAWLAVPGAPEPPEEVCKALPATLVSPDVSSFAVTDPAIPVGPDDAACLTFTSGSTGKPKAVVGLHGSLSHFLPFMAERFSLSSADRFGMLSALAHDPFQRDLFTPLWLGAALCVPDPERIASPGYLADWVRRHEVTVLNLTPAMLEVLVLAAEELGEELASLARAFVVGDALKRSDVDRLRRCAPNVTVTNLYGATETQRALAFFDVPAAGSGREVIPLGRGMDGAQLLIVSDGGGLAGVGELGEIHLRSPHLARGYLDDPALTAERFLPDASGRRYKTGDLGRYLPDGNAEIVGRADFQVKIRGFRIELGEVEAALSRHPGVDECVVLVREDRPGDRRLVAYVAGEGAPEVEELRGFLLAALPDYMVPQAVVRLSALPVTPAGKIDRLGLPAPVWDVEGHVAPRNESEAVLAAVWAEVLRVERVGVFDNFFALGGDSILAIKLVSRLRQRGYDLPPREVFLHQTVAAQAALLPPGSAGVPPAAVPIPEDALAEVGMSQDELDAVLADL